MKLLVGWVILASVVGLACGNSEPQIPTPTVVESSQAFWELAKPIVERQIAEVGTPISEIIILIDGSPNELELSEMYETFLGVAPSLRESYDELSNLNAPLGRADRWHQSQLSSWGKRLDSINVLASNWDKENAYCIAGITPLGNFSRMTTEEILAESRFNAVCQRGGFTGSGEEMERMSQLWDQSILSGLESDRLQVDLLRWLSESDRTEVPTPN